MQNAKDSFYEVLRSRLAGLNPERTVVVRGITRPALVIDENETESVSALPDCFHLRWTKQNVTASGPMPLVTMTCEISYATSGTGMNAGIDRGRNLAAMDAELAAVLHAYPQNALKTDFSGLAFGNAPVPMSTKIWWGEVSFADAKVSADRVTRVASVEVMSLQEAGEL